MCFKNIYYKKLLNFHKKVLKNAKNYHFSTVCGIREAHENAYGRSGFANIEVKLCRTSSNIPNYMNRLCHFEFGDMTQKCPSLMETTLMVSFEKIIVGRGTFGSCYQIQNGIVYSCNLVYLMMFCTIFTSIFANPDLP